MALDPSVFVHPNALCESHSIGAGTRIWAFAHVMAGAIIGANCNICDHAFVETGANLGDRVTIKNAVLLWDRVTIENDVFIGPNVVFTNDLRPRAAVKKSPDEFLPTVVRRGATIGAQATIVCGITIREHAFIAAGSVVISDVPAYAFVAGNPARRRGWVCECGQRVDAELSCECGCRYQLTNDEIGLSRMAGGPEQRAEVGRDRAL